jgi:hypothetical protein
MFLGKLFAVPFSLWYSPPPLAGGAGIDLCLCPGEAPPPPIAFIIVEWRPANLRQKYTKM